MNDIENVIFDIAEALRGPVLVLALLALAVSLIELGAFIVELVRRRRRDYGRLETASTEARAALERGDEAGAKAALRPVAWSTAMARSLAFIIEQRSRGQSGDRMAKGLADFDFRSLKRLERTRLLVRAGPALGLMGTLIPLSPALEGLANGDTEELSDNLRVAFSVTVLGLLIGAIAFAISLVRDRLYGQDLSDLEFVAATIAPDAGLGGAAAPLPAGGARPATTPPPPSSPAPVANKPPPPTGAKPLSGDLPPPGGAPARPAGTPSPTPAAAPGGPTSAPTPTPSAGGEGSAPPAPMPTGGSSASADPPAHAPHAPAQPEGATPPADQPPPAEVGAAPAAPAEPPPPPAQGAAAPPPPAEQQGPSDPPLPPPPIPEPPTEQLPGTSAGERPTQAQNHPPGDGHNAPAPAPENQ